MADLYWPGRLLVPAHAKAQAAPNNTSGGQSFAGAERVTGNTPGRWKLALRDIRVCMDSDGVSLNQDRIRAWNGIEAALQGRLNTILVPVYDYLRAPWPVVNGKNVRPAKPASVWKDIFTRYTPASTAIQATANADIAAGAMTGVIALAAGSALDVCHFEADERVYRINRVVSVSGNVYTVKFWPPVRETISSGTALNFDDPCLRCRLSGDEDMAIKDGFEYWRRATPSLDFVEDV